MKKSKIKRILNDPWPVQTKEQKEKTLDAIKRAAKAGIFDYDSQLKKKLTFEK